jgi:NTE family protein
VTARPLLVLLVILLCCTSPQAGFTEEQSLTQSSISAAETSPRRPRIGLVLGGGGARGAAHIGVLQELERMHVPIDAIVGTSMGAIIGGLYASGVSVEELEETVATLDWANAMSDQAERRDLSFRRKKDEEQFPINVEIGYRDGEFKLPPGAIQGHNLELVLRRLTIHASQIKDFDKLPVPFRAVASDLVTGDPYVMAGGDLALAIRASMSVPGVLAPIRVDDHLLADGGLVGNLAINVIREMDVDIIIAVDVEFPLYEIDDLGSALAVSEQMITLLIRKETQRQIDTLGPKDILIQPDLGTFASTNFAAAAETIPAGVAAIRDAADKLSLLSVDAARYSSYRAMRKTPAPIDADLAVVRVIHDVKVAPEILAARMNVKAGDPIDMDTLEAEADILFGLRLFEKVGYRLVTEGDQTGVEFTARQKSWGPNYFRFGLSLEDDFEGSTGFNVATRWRRPEVNSLGAEFSTDLRLGTDPLLSTEFYQPLRFDSRIFIAPRLSVEQYNRNVFVMDDAVGRLRFSEAQLSFDAGAEIGTVGEFRIGLYRGVGQARVKIGDPSIQNIEYETGGLSTRLKFDTFDDAQFPKRGLRTGITWNSSRTALGADTQYDTVDFNFSTALSHGKNTWVIGVEYSTTLDTLSPVRDYFQLGGFLRLSGLERGQITGPHAALARVVYLRQVGSSAGGILQVPLYLGASIEAGNTWQLRSDMSFDSTITNGSLFFGLDTFFGPMYLAAGFAENGDTNFYLFIGATPP